jgi:hypothetical protein
MEECGFILVAWEREVCDPGLQIMEVALLKVLPVKPSGLYSQGCGYDCPVHASLVT